VHNASVEEKKNLLAGHALPVHDEQMVAVTTLNFVVFVGICLVDEDASIIDSKFEFVCFDVFPALGTNAVNVTPVIMLCPACGFFPHFGLGGLSKAENVKVLRSLT
jgi:hypothetical protein